MLNNKPSQFTIISLTETPTELKLFKEITEECIENKTHDKIDASEIHRRLEYSDRLILLFTKYLKKNSDYVLPPMSAHIPENIYTEEFWRAKRTASHHPATFFWAAQQSQFFNKALKRKETENIVASVPNNNNDNNKKYNKKK